MVQRIRRDNGDLEIEKNEDLELVERVKKGERSAFSLLVRKHQKGLMRLCIRFMKDSDMAEDVVQDSFIKAYERLSSFEARASFKSWLYQIAVNTAKNKLRDRRGQGPSIDDVPLAIAARAESKLVHGAVAKMIQAQVDELPMKQRTALILRVYEDLSFKEIAEIMDCPYDTAKANYRHALMKLREEFQKQPELRHWTEETGGFFIEMHRKVSEAEA